MKLTEAERIRNQIEECNNILQTKPKDLAIKYFTKAIAVNPTMSIGSGS